MLITWAILIVRLSSIFIVQTWFVPDEFWQSLEVSHHSSFGHGYLTWEFEYGLRSFLPITFYNIIFKLLDCLGLTSPSFFVMIPRILQAVVFCFCEISFCRMTRKRFGSSVCNWTSFFLLSSWFLYYTCSRTLANTTELSLLQLALCGYGWNAGPSSRQFYIAGFFSCLMRPTAVVSYIPLGLIKLLSAGKREMMVLVGAVPYLLSMLLISVGIDSYMYSRFVISQWNFLKFNVLSDGASFFGTHHFAWYFTEGLPPLLGPLAIVVLFEGYFCFRGRTRSQFGYPLFVLRACLAFTCVVYSLQPHKEHRFLLPMLPVCALIAGIFCSEYFSFKEVKRERLRHGLVSSTLIFNIILGIYFSLVHQRAPMDVVRYLAAEAVATPNMSVLFLLPCHSTPFYSHVHYGIRMKFFTCRPNFEKKENYLDEADEFFSDPVTVTTSLLQSDYTHLVTGSYLGDSIFDLLSMSGYERKNVFFHQLLPEGRVGRYMHIFTKLTKNSSL